jgi:predicted enzyme involved in methoxymalonyl-ACP biosynthesis
MHGLSYDLSLNQHLYEQNCVWNMEELFNSPRNYSFEVFIEDEFSDSTMCCIFIISEDAHLIMCHLTCLPLRFTGRRVGHKLLFF